MRIVALDLVRFFAAISVVLYHYVSEVQAGFFYTTLEITKFGYLGVPVFFIISGYVITMSASNRTAIQFAISRFVRLYPALWASILFTVAVTQFLSNKSYSLYQILANFTLLNDYMGLADVDGVYWTLKAEIKFYACIFLLIAFGIFKKHTTWLAVWLGITIVYTFTNQPFFMGWFITPHYSSFFIAGVAFYLLKNGVKYSSTILVLSLILSSFKTFNQASGFIEDPEITDRLISVLVIVFFYCFMYCMGTGKINLNEKKIYTTLGAISYPLYLIHNMAGKAIIHRFSNTINEDLLIILTVLIMIMVSWLIFAVIEKPISKPLKNHLSILLKQGKSTVK